MIPAQDLPLQSIIQFEPCPTDVAASYLQAVCFAEGYTVDRDLISHLYLYPLQGDPAKIFSPSFPTATPDLRRTLNALQIKCATFAKPAPGIIPACNSLAVEGPSEADAAEAHPFAQPVAERKARALGKKSEFLSFLDGELVRDPSDIITVRQSWNFGIV